MQKKIQSGIKIRITTKIEYKTLAQSGEHSTLEWTACESDPGSGLTSHINCVLFLFKY